MKLLSIVVALSSFLSMTEGANLRSIHKQAPVSKGRESPVVGSLRQQILDDNSDAAWERELKGKKGVNKKKEKKNKNKKNEKKNKKKSNKGLNKKQKRNCRKNPSSYAYCPVSVTTTAAVYLNIPGTPPGRKLLQNDSGLSLAAVGALEITIRNLLEDEGLNVDSVTVISITVDYLVTYDAVLNLPQGTSEAQAQSIVDSALEDITQKEFQDELKDNLIGVDCGGIECSDLGDATKTVSTLSPSSSPSSSPSKAPTGAPSPSPSPDPLTPSPSVNTLIESTADGFEVIPWENDRYLV